MFARFWAEYPRKVGQAEARRVFHQLSPRRELLAKMIEALVWQRQTPQWQQDGGRFIPYPATWLRGARWLDEPVTTTTVSDAEFFRVHGFHRRP